MGLASDNWDAMLSEQSEMVSFHVEVVIVL